MKITNGKFIFTIAFVFTLLLLGLAKSGLAPESNKISSVKVLKTIFDEFKIMIEPGISTIQLENKAAEIIKEKPIGVNSPQFTNMESI